MNEEVEAIRNGAAVVRRDDLYTLRIAGPDRERFLNGMITSDVSKLATGRMQRAIKPNNRGRVEGMLRVRAEDDAYLIDVLETSAQRVATELNKLIIMDDVTLSDATDTREVIAVYGPSARKLISEAGWAVPALEDLSYADVGDVRVMRDDGVIGVEGYEILALPRKGDDAVKALIVAGAIEVDEDSLDIVRVESGVARDGVDVDDDTIPLEANLVDWISFTKGCYVGQEVIARAHNLGGVKHRLVGLRVEGDTVPPKDAKIVVGEEDTGEVTSAVRSDAHGVIALGYVHTKNEAEGTEVQLVWGDAKAKAAVTKLPF
ncbi:MAG: glycine cleavage T C-terminal barrel domain-containing protein [Deltaproteobacteria bacterium]